MVDVSKMTRPLIAGHGGGCCGISHIYGFSGFRWSSSNNPRNSEDAERRVRFLISKYWADSGRRLDDRKNRLYEAVLRESQREEWEPVLLAVGFELVTDFLNTNSGNRCYVYHYAMGPSNKHGPYKSPYKVSKKKTSVPNPFEPGPAVDIPY